MNTNTCISDADLTRLWEHEITPTERAALEQHLETCASCKARWDQMVQGAQYIDDALDAALESSTDTGCPSNELMSRYQGGQLDAEEQRRIEEHLGHCERCRQQQRLVRELSEAYDREGANWWSQYVGQQVLALIARVPREVDNLVDTIGAPARLVQASGQPIQLPVLEPLQAEARRLAAATGRGLSEQTLRQDNPPTEFHLVQFGDQLRIAVRALGERAAHRDCLARLDFNERGIVKLSRVILMHDGQGQCTLEPSQTRALRPQQVPLDVTIVPIVTLKDLDEAGPDAYMPILTRLLRNDDPTIRQHAIEVIARICGPSARELIQPLAVDQNEDVRAAARKALNGLPG